MKRVVAAMAVSLFAVGAVAAPASAGNGYGKFIKDECDAPFGKVLQAGKAAAEMGAHPEIKNAKGGAKAFAMTIPDVHCS